MKKLYVQFGSGLSCPEGWQNLDVSPRLRVERLPIVGSLIRAGNMSLFPAKTRFGDIVKGLPIENGTVDGVYSSHVLEHLPHQDMKIALQNTFKMLKTDGVLRLIVPDLQWRAQEYLDRYQDEDPNGSFNFMRKSHLGIEARSQGVSPRLREILGNSAHLWMYDQYSMATELKEAGFSKIHRCEMGDSGIPEFSLVEDESRFFDSGNPELAMEAVKQ